MSYMKDYLMDLQNAPYEAAYKASLEEEGDLFEASEMFWYSVCEPLYEGVF